MTVDQLDNTIHKIYFAFESADDEHYSSEYVSHWVEMFYSDIDPQSKLFTSAAAAKNNAMQYIGIEFPTELIKFYYGADWYKVDSSITDIKGKDTLINEAFVPLTPTFNQLRNIYDKADFLRIRRPKTSFAKWYTMNKDQLNSEVNRVKAYYNLRALPVKEGDYFFHKNTGKWLATNDLEKFEEANGGFEKTVVWINGEPTAVDNPQSFIDKLRSLFSDFRQRIINGIDSVWDWLCKVFPALRHVENAFDAASNGLFMIDTNLVSVHDGIINWFVGELADNENGYTADEIVDLNTRGFAGQEGAFTDITGPEDQTDSRITKSESWLGKILGRIGDFFNEVNQNIRNGLSEFGINFENSKLNFKSDIFNKANPLKNCSIFAFTGTVNELKRAKLLDSEGKPKSLSDIELSTIWKSNGFLHCFKKYESNFFFKRKAALAKPVVLINNSQHLPNYSDTSGQNSYTPEFLYKSWETQLKQQYSALGSNERFLPDISKAVFYFETRYDPNAADNAIPSDTQFMNVIGGAKINCNLPKIKVNFSFTTDNPEPANWKLESLNFDWGAPWYLIEGKVREEFNRLMIKYPDERYTFDQTNTTGIPLCQKYLTGNSLVYNYVINYEKVEKVSITFKNSLWNYDTKGYKFTEHTKDPDDTSQDSKFTIQKFAGDEITFFELSEYKNQLMGTGQKTEFQGYIKNTSENLTTAELVNLTTAIYIVLDEDSYIHFVNYAQLTLSYDFPEPSVDYIKENEYLNYGAAVSLSNRNISSNNFFLEKWYQSYLPETDDFATELTEITMDNNKTVYGKMARQGTVIFTDTDFQPQEIKVGLKDKWYYSEPVPTKAGAKFLGVYDNFTPPFDYKIDRRKDINAIALEQKNTNFYGIYGYEITLPSNLTYYDFSQKHCTYEEDGTLIETAINEYLTLPTHVSEMRNGQEVRYKPIWKKSGEDLVLSSSYKFNSNTTLVAIFNENNIKKKVTIQYVTKNGDAYTQIGSVDYYLDKDDWFAFPTQIEAMVGGQNNMYPVNDFYLESPTSPDFNPNAKIPYTSFQIGDSDKLFYAIVETTETLYSITTKYEKHIGQLWFGFETLETTAWYASGQKVYLEPYYLRGNTYYQVKWFDGDTKIETEENNKFVYEVTNSTTLVGKLQPTQHWKVEFYNKTGEWVQTSYYADEARLDSETTPDLTEGYGWYSGETTDSQQYTDDSLITTNLVLRELEIPIPPEEP